jgi:hypothetical protein
MILIFNDKNHNYFNNNNFLYSFFMKSPKKSMIKLTRNHFNNSPIRSYNRMKSSSPLIFRKYTSCNNLAGLYQYKVSNKNSNRECFSIKKHYLEKINTRIPEESEGSNLEKEITRKETKNNNYYINYIKNIYESEPHLNKETFIKTPNNKFKTYNKFDDSNGKLYKRRLSSFTDQLLCLNFHKKFCAEKGQHNTSPINKMKSLKLNNLIKKKKSNEIDILRKHSNNLSKSKSKRKNKSKGISKDKDTDKYKNNDKKSKNNIENKKIKENIKIKDNDIQISTKVETLNNNKIKNKTIKNLLCCLINDNELSTEND